MYLKNGSEVSKSEFNISIEDLAVWRGDGVFEAIKIHQGYPFGIERHIKRFKKSAEKVFFNNIDFDEIKNKLEDYIEVEDISKVPLNSHLRYFTEKYDEKKKYAEYLEKEGSIMAKS